MAARLSFLNFFLESSTDVCFSAFHVFWGGLSPPAANAAPGRGLFDTNFCFRVVMWSVFNQVLSKGWGLILFPPAGCAAPGQRFINTGFFSSCRT